MEQAHAGGRGTRWWGSSTGMSEVSGDIKQGTDCGPFTPKWGGDLALVPPSKARPCKGVVAQWKQKWENCPWAQGKQWRRAFPALRSGWESWHKFSASATSGYEIQLYSRYPRTRKTFTSSMETDTKLLCRDTFIIQEAEKTSSQ